MMKLQNLGVKERYAITEELPRIPLAVPGFRKVKLARKDISRMLSVFVIFVLVSTATAHAFCPVGCQCDEENLVVACIEANLDVIPIALNPAIQRLVLKYNRIKTVDAALQFYSGLQYLDLSYNHLVNIPQTGFDAQKDLVELHLNHNKISSVTNRTFNYLNKLKVLSLRGNFLEDLPDRLFSALQNLEELDLGKNRITRIDSAAFSGLPNLRVLYLDDNMLRNVPTTSFPYLGGLAELHVGLNQFTTLNDDTFKGLNKLSILDVSAAGLSNIADNAFRGLATLRSLVLTSNKLVLIPTKQLSALSRLEDLFIGQNEFSVVEVNAFKGLSNLRHVDISGASNLEKIMKGAFTENLNIDTLTFSSNKKLRSIEDGALAGLPNLRHLTLRDNSFTTFPESLVAWPELRKLDLSDNPIDCACNLLWLKELLLQRNTSHILCASPAPLKNRSLKVLSPDDLGCSLHDTQKQAIIGAICATAVFLAALIGLMLYRYRQAMHNVFKDMKWNKPKIIGKEQEYQKASSDDDFRNAQHTLKHVPVTEL
uniref:LRRCT domain-containing protein n=2 Tax=Clastoptera arizonana TaxID=38151 RepID=A0A1B6EGN5_9HEMI